MEENKVLEETTNEVIENVDNVNEIIESSNGNSSLLGMAIGAGIFALGIGAYKGIKYGVHKFKSWRASKKIEEDDIESTVVADLDDVEVKQESEVLPTNDDNE